MSIVFLFQGMSLDLDFCGSIREMSKVISHFQDHKAYGDSFIDFVIEDYIDKDTKGEDHHSNSDEQDLPVHSHHQCCQSALLFIANNSILSMHHVSIEERKQITTHKESFSSRYMESPFQPPRV